MLNYHPNSVINEADDKAVIQMSEIHLFVFGGVLAPDQPFATHSESRRILATGALMFLFIARQYILLLWVSD